MSDNIPFELQIEIIQRIPDIKWVIQYRSVSKAWKSLIDSKDFVSAHTLRHIHRQPRRLLIKGQDSGHPREVKYISILDDDTFPHQKSTLFVPDFCKKAKLVGTSHGLVCLYDDKISNIVVIWNPSIRKTVVVGYDKLSSTTTTRNDVVFGVCPDTLDSKSVKISYVTGNDIPQVEVFSLSERAWRRPLSDTRPRNSISVDYIQAVIDGVIYWEAIDSFDNLHAFITSFDLTSEEFTELHLPNPPRGLLTVSNLRDSLGVFDMDPSGNERGVDVWIMRGRGATRSFEMIHNIIPPVASSISLALGFRRSGAPVLEMKNDQGYQPAYLAAYEPESNDMTEIWRHRIIGMSGTFRVHSYMETLLLLDH